MATRVSLQYALGVVLSLLYGIRIVQSLTETSDSADSQQQQQQQQHSPLKFIVEPTGELFVRENSKVILNCSAAAADNRLVTITWRKDGRAISGLGSSYSSPAESDETSRITVDQSGSLVIVGVVRRHGVSDHPRLEAVSKSDTSSSRDSRRRPAANHRGVVGGENSVGGDQGLYECLASHPTYGTIASTPVHLRIVSLASKFSSSPPAGVSSVAGQSVRLHCSIKAVPPVAIRWVKDGKPIIASEADQHRITVLDKLGVLQLGAVQISDNGLYKCVADDGFDQRTSSGTQLTVRHPSPDERIAATLVYHSPGEIKAALLSTVTVECFVTGLPPPSVVWTRRGQRVSSSSHSRARVFGSGNLLIDSLLQSDEGLYTCTWTDQVTMVTASAAVNISVLVPPRARVKLDAITRRYQGDALRLECAFNGRPTPSVRWLKNGELYVSKDPRIRVENTDRGYSNLVINATTVAEYSGGMYQCRANNTLGVTMQTTWVNIELSDDGAKPPVNVSVQALGSSSILVTWKDSPQNAAHSVVAYHVEYFVTDSDREKRVGQVVQVGTYKMLIEGLQSETNYSVCIETLATSGRSKSSELITVVTGVDRSKPRVLVQTSSTQGVPKHAFTTLSILDLNWKSDAVNFDARSIEADVPLLTDQQLGILIGSCVGISCIFFSVFILILRNSCCVRPVGSGHRGAIANGSLPESRTLVCHCHLVNNGTQHLLRDVRSPNNIRELPLQLVDGQNCDTKGGFTISNCNGKGKPLSSPSNSHHLLSGKDYTTSDPSEHLLSSSPGVHICAVNEEALPLRNGTDHYDDDDLDLDGIDYDVKNDENNCNGTAIVSQTSEYKTSHEAVPVPLDEEELPAGSPNTETRLKLASSQRLVELSL